MVHITKGNLGKVALPVVSPIEQEKIAQFLDVETAKIDTLIEKQQQLIALLKEKRQAVISHAVTKGLNPDAPMRDSGVEWLGEVPAHWEVGGLSFYATIVSGSTPDRNRSVFWENGSIPWIKTGEVKYQPISETEESITELASRSTAVTLSPPGTLLMAMYGQGVTRGRVAILNVHATYNQACAGIHFIKGLNPSFYQYFFIAAYDYVRDSGNETSQMNLNTEIVGKMKICVPSEEEQHEIVRHLDRLLPDMDTAESKAMTLISLLRERKNALVSAAVTGKIDVRNWKPETGVAVA